MTSSIFDHELNNNAYVPKINAYYFKQWEGYEMDFHTHKEVEIMYVMDGKCTVGVLTDALVLKKGDFILLDTNVPHRLIVETGVPCRMLNIEFTFISNKRYSPSIKDLVKENQILAQFLTMKETYLVLKDSNQIYHTLKNIVLESDKKQGMMVHLLLSQLLIQIARMAISSQELEKEDQQANIYVNQALEFIHEHYDQDIKVKDIAEAVNLHPGYLQRIFKKMVHMSLIEYVNSFRMEKAKMLLVDTEIPIIEISQYVGMNSSQYFSQVFKKYTKQTPVDYRRSSVRTIEKWNKS
ncbi:AraC family transcriptional regulator [Lederbergia sp. NSJ-179]|uniref:AraC family transcriptional regulator n=1 Tax=Lederbergia sp. NSJ-179 TaxID=2931402 RepID=UPI001FD4B80E|nr:AraC family transcriptional regulator [Lederbergia sp. NSJ-179]MCJ7843223.1 AraC family transcriptional regulator [Lederbergia sp. NSJ-179]